MCRGAVINPHSPRTRRTGNKSAMRYELLRGLCLTGDNLILMPASATDFPLFQCPNTIIDQFGLSLRVSISLTVIGIRWIGIGRDPMSQLAPPAMSIQTLITPLSTSNVTVIISGCHFMWLNRAMFINADSTAGIGGSVFGADIQILDCEFHETSMSYVTQTMVTWNGGAIAVVPKSILYFMIDRSQFIGCTVSNAGGAISIASINNNLIGSITIVHSLFSSNGGLPNGTLFYRTGSPQPTPPPMDIGSPLSSGGGAIFIATVQLGLSLAANITISDCEFDLNTAPSATGVGSGGGAITLSAVEGIFGASTLITRSRFTRCNATTNGGAISIQVCALYAVVPSALTPRSWHVSGR